MGVSVQAAPMTWDSKTAVDVMDDFTLCTEKCTKATLVLLYWHHILTENKLTTRKIIRRQIRETCDSNMAFSVKQS